METWRASSRCHEEFMGERRPTLRHPWGPVGEELGAEGLGALDRGNWAGGLTAVFAGGRLHRQADPRPVNLKVDDAGYY